MTRNIKLKTLENHIGSWVVIKKNSIHGVENEKIESKIWGPLNKDEKGRLYIQNTYFNKKKFYITHGSNIVLHINSKNHASQREYTRICKYNVI